MKRITACLIAACFASLPVFAQDDVLPAIPATAEKLGVIYYFPAVPSSSLPVTVPLSQELAVTKTSSTKPFAGAKTYAELKGAKSAVQLSAAETKEFFVRGVDPTRFKLYWLESKKNTREIQIYRAGVLNLHGKIITQNAEIPISIVELGESRYKLVPSAPLAEGEYAFSPTDSNDAFTFGVVAPEELPISGN